MCEHSCSDRTNGVPADPFAAAGSPPPLAGVCIMQLQRTATDVAYCAAPSGDSNTTDYRLFLEKEGASLHRIISDHLSDL